jgi:hypothetical protein
LQRGYGNHAVRRDSVSVINSLAGASCIRSFQQALEFQRQFHWRFLLRCSSVTDAKSEA